MSERPTSTGLSAPAFAAFRRHTDSFAVQFALVALSHVVAYRVMDWFPFIQSEAMPMWIPTGVSLFMLIWWSPRFWPAVLVAELVMGSPLSAEALIECFANTSELALASWAFLAVFKRRERLFDLTGMIGALGIGGVGAPILTGFVVVALHAYSGFTFVHTETGNVLQWAIGDYNGTLLILPLLSGLANLRAGHPLSRWRRVELFAALSVLVFCTGLIFDAWPRLPGFNLGDQVMANAFFLTPILAWIGFRFAQPWTSLAFLLSATLGVWQTVHDHGPFAHYTYDGSVLWLEMFMAVGGTCSVLIAASRRQIDVAEERLSRSEESYRLLFMANPHPMWVIDPETLRFVEVNRSAIQKYGYSRDEFLNMTIREIRPTDEVEKLTSKLSEIRESDRDFGTWLHRTKDGQLLHVEVTGCRYEIAGQTFRLVLAADVTERRMLEAELRQSQKLEALGRLAGGVAHDFNNLLMIMGSYAEMLQQESAELPRITRQSQRILQAIDRASALTHQLLAFSRNQVLAPKNINLDVVVNDTVSMIERLIGEDIELRLIRSEPSCHVKLDAGQLTQVLLNLCSNARDAMFGHGILTLSTGIFRSAGVQLRGNGMLPVGTYATLTVSDTGKGIAPELQEHIYEPFFTTKDLGKGTGLGLATVYGIVKQSGGYIELKSSPGMGSEFTLYFPQASEGTSSGEAQQDAHLESGEESILVAEDEPDLRAAIVDSLQSLGYRVWEAVDGYDAMEVANKLSSLDLLVTDVVMPRMPGTELAVRLRGRFPQSKVLLMSGYTKGSVEAEQLGPDTIFVPKPISLRALASSIRTLLTQRPAPQP